MAARTPPRPSSGSSRTTDMAGNLGVGTQPSGTETPPEKSSKKRAQLSGLVGDGVEVGVGERVGERVGSEVVGDAVAVQQVVAQEPSIGVCVQMAEPYCAKSAGQTFSTCGEVWAVTRG